MGLIHVVLWMLCQPVSLLPYLTVIQPENCLSLTLTASPERLKLQSTDHPGIYHTVPICREAGNDMWLCHAFFGCICFWSCWVFVAVHGLSLVATSRGYSWLQCVGISSWRLLLLWSTGSRLSGFSTCSTWAQSLAQGIQSTGLVIVVLRRLHCCATCGIFQDQGWKQCPLHCKMDS